MASMSPEQITHAYLEDLTLSHAQYDAYMHVRSLFVGSNFPYPETEEAQKIAHDLLRLIPCPAYMNGD